MDPESLAHFDFLFSPEEKIGMKSEPLMLAEETLKMWNLVADVDSFTSQSVAEELAIRNGLFSFFTFTNI